ncbi:hypothetical protein, partial [Streptomyces werraensis]|uniref:hypothetical protein n=1 Tax=Streptomyces werraensis TaxID=68284 RepID=UPI00368D6066
PEAAGRPVLDRAEHGPREVTRRDAREVTEGTRERRPDGRPAHTTLEAKPGSAQGPGHVKSRTGRIP